MSYSFRNPARVARHSSLGAAVVIACAGGHVIAAQVYVRPLAEVTTEVSTNRSLVTDGTEEKSEGYNARFGGTLDISTPRSATIIKPVISYSSYPDADDNSVEGVVDFASRYSSQRSKIEISGRFDYQSLYSSELANAEFNPINPDLPTTPETGRVTVDGNRTLVTLVPNYEYSITQRLGFGVNGVFQTIDYSGLGAGAQYVSYDYLLGSTYLNWALSPRTDMSAGVFVSRTSDKDDDGATKSRGVNLSFDYSWSQTFTGELELTFQRDEVTPPVGLKETSNNVAATYTTSWKGEVSQADLSIGRTITPGGSGGAHSADQFQFQYRRLLSARTEFLTAARFIRYESVANANANANSDYDYLNLNAGLKWKMSPTWYLSGGVEYWREKFQVPSATADNVIARISVGYEGLERPR